ncbi:ferrochelatase [Roseibium salinum]|nr:ferrochelatase [Roseibium salinum]
MLLVNLGTPDATDYWPMRRYLREFLSDKRVIEWPRAIWYPILYGIVLMTRPGKSGKAYEEIWNHEKKRVAAQDNYPQPVGKSLPKCSATPAAV